MSRTGVEHYENFPVASLLCPATLRPAVRALYRYARTADDLADEGDASPQARRQALADYRAALHAAVAGEVGPRWRDVFAPLAAAIRSHRLPLAPLDDLIDAFVADTCGRGFSTRAELLDYCRRSANPIGRLLLHLCGIDDADALRQSDAICSALQLINFWQDASVDLPRGRCNFPREDLDRHRIAAATLAAGRDTAATRAMVRELCAWASALMAEGAPLVWRMPARMGFELRLVVQGGLRIAEKLGAIGWRSLSQRPTLRARDLPVLLYRAARMRRSHAATGWRPA